MRYHGLYLGVQLRFVTIANKKKHKLGCNRRNYGCISTQVVLKKNINHQYPSHKKTKTCFYSSIHSIINLFIQVFSYFESLLTNICIEIQKNMSTYIHTYCTMKYVGRGSGHQMEIDFPWLFLVRRPFADLQVTYPRKTHKYICNFIQPGFQNIVD